jgi:hypothetical protein
MARRGVTIGWIIIFILLIYVVIVGIRLAKIYINDFHLRGIIKQESRYFIGKDRDLIKKIVKKASSSNIVIGKENLSVIEMNDTHVIFRVSYSRVLDGIFFKYNWNMDYDYEVRTF